MYVLLFWTKENNYSIHSFNAIVSPRRDYEDYEEKQDVSAKYQGKIYPARIIKKHKDRKHLETKMDEIINSVIKQTETEKQSEKNEDRKHLETNMDEIINSVTKQTETEKQSEKNEDRKHLETNMDEIINSVTKQTETEKQSEKNGANSSNSAKSSQDAKQREEQNNSTLEKSSVDEGAHSSNCAKSSQDAKQRKEKNNAIPHSSNSAKSSQDAKQRKEKNNAILEPWSVDEGADSSLNSAKSSQDVKQRKEKNNAIFETSSVDEGSESTDSESILSPMSPRTSSSEEKENTRSWKDALEQFQYSKSIGKRSLDTDSEIKELKDQVKRLKRRVEKLEEKRLSSSKAGNDTTNCSEMSDPIKYNGFTLNELKLSIEHVESCQPAIDILLRKMFTSEEITSQSVTGKKLLNVHLLVQGHQWTKQNFML
ncbi:Hypothetical predicted protein [Mytilus galloprovincialis]|uniref:BEN domain-containing protein n=1 Tax=Mytilus galloprovincialis TaxID=29158 RepID=A0A8B6CNT3_MYTGA|nr:Hypothetical predicted protein [Mytilus galloprovincialis]